MIKICITVRNRLAVTKKCIESIHKHTTQPFQIYVYDNLTSHRFKDHIDYYTKQFRHNIISKFIINSDSSTYNCFSKVCAFNEFGFDHEQDPDKDGIDFLVLLDNDMILTPAWNEKAFAVINGLSNHENIHIVTQCPGGVSDRKESITVNGIKCDVGVHGGSGFWILKPTFFREIGYLDCNLVKGLNKKHDQNYWRKIEKVTNGKKYALAIHHIMALHTGPVYSGSVCNILTKDKMDFKNIRLEEEDKNIENMDFDTFYNEIKDNERCQNW